MQTAYKQAYIQTLWTNILKYVILSYALLIDAIKAFELAAFIGELSEWLKEHDWKSCIRRKRIPGSNPGLSASK